MKKLLALIVVSFALTVHAQIEVAPNEVFDGVFGQDQDGNNLVWNISRWDLATNRVYRFEHANFGTTNWIAYPQIIDRHTNPVSIAIYAYPKYQVPYTKWYSRTLDYTDAEGKRKTAMNGELEAFPKEGGQWIFIYTNAPPVKWYQLNVTNFIQDASTVVEN